MVNKYQVGFTQEFPARLEDVPLDESYTVNKYLEGIDQKDASELSTRATELLKSNNPQIAELIKDLGGERVVAHRKMPPK